MAKESDISSTSIFERLPLIVLIRDFYQFALVIEKVLWNNLLKEDDIHGKSL